MIYLVHGMSADKVREMVKQGKSFCADAIYEMANAATDDYMSVAQVAAAYTKLVRQMQEKGIEPVSWEVRVQEQFSSFAELTAGELLQWAYDHPDAPLPRDGQRHVIRLATGELMVVFSVESMRQLIADGQVQVADDYTAYDRGDLCAELDRALGDLIERVIHRYMPEDLAADVRHQICGDLADIVIDYDKSHGDPAKA